MAMAALSSWYECDNYWPWDSAKGSPAVLNAHHWPWTAQTGALLSRFVVLWNTFGLTVNKTYSIVNTFVVTRITQAGEYARSATSVARHESDSRNLTVIDLKADSPVAWGPDGGVSRSARWGAMLNWPRYLFFRNLEAWPL